jgi:ferredoxin
MRVHVDRVKCLAAGVCSLKASHVFDQDDEGVVTLLDENPAAGLDAVVEAAGSCPAEAIRIERTSEGSR